MEVINCRKANLNKKGYSDLLDWLKDPNHVYIGRNMTFYVPGAVASKWANPFTVKKCGRDKALQEYRKWITNKPELMKVLVKELDGKILACWCASDKCHGDILIELIKELKAQEKSE